MSLDHPDHARWLVEHVMPYEPLLRGWLQGRFGAQVEIDDIVQDAYARLLRARAQGTVVFTDGRLRWCDGRPRRSLAQRQHARLSPDDDRRGAASPRP